MTPEITVEQRRKYREIDTRNLRAIFIANPRGEMRRIFPKAARQGIGARSVSEIVVCLIHVGELKVDTDSGRYEWIGN